MTGGTGREYGLSGIADGNDAALLVPPPYPRNKLSCNPSKTPDGGAVTPVTPATGEPLPRPLVARLAGVHARPTPFPAPRVYKPTDCEKGFHSSPRCAKMRGRTRARSEV